MTEETNALSYMKDILNKQGANFITDFGYEVLENQNIITNHSQAKGLAQIIKDVGVVNYNQGCKDGISEQAFNDGLKMGQEAAKYEQRIAELESQVANLQGGN